MIHFMIIKYNFIRTQNSGLLSTKAGRAFSHLARELWNSLPDDVLFKPRSYLFSQAFTYASHKLEIEIVANTHDYTLPEMLLTAVKLIPLLLLSCSYLRFLKCASSSLDPTFAIFQATPTITSDYGNFVSTRKTF